MKTKEELKLLKEEIEALNNKLHELTEEELGEIIGGSSAMDIVERVINGDYGNGQKRNRNIRTEEYDYGYVQDEVKQRLGYKKEFPKWEE